MSPAALWNKFKEMFPEASKDIFKFERLTADSIYMTPKEGHHHVIFKFEKNGNWLVKKVN